jgi:proteasome lid subunit RPN8/RPN11
VVKIYRSAYLGMARDAESGYPHEVCGVMIGQKDTVTHFRKCANLVADESVETAFKETGNIDSKRLKDRYELDPRSYIEADSWARENGLEILGIYHSHPDHPSVPSETDRQVASPGWAYIIFSVSRGKLADARIWYIDEQDFQFQERKFEVVKDPD